MSQVGRVCIACASFEARGHLEGYCMLHKVKSSDGSVPKNACASWRPAMGNYSVSDVVPISTSQIDQSEYAMRRLDETVVSDLIVSIKTQGLLQPLMVRPKDGRYEIVFGRHRLVACLRLGYSEVPCVVRELGDDEATLIQITENIQRNIRVDPVQEGRFYSELHKQRLSTYTIGRKIGKSAVYVQDRISIYEKLHPRLKELVSLGSINPSIGHRLAELPSKRHQLQVVQEAKNHLTVQSIDGIVRGHIQSFTRCDCRICPTHGPMLRGGKQPPLEGFYFAGTWIRCKSNIEERTCVFCGHILKIGEYSFPLRYKGTLTSYESCKPCAFAHAPLDFQALFTMLTSHQSPRKFAYLQKAENSTPVCPICASNHYVQKGELRQTSRGWVQRYVCTRCPQRFSVSLSGATKEFTTVYRKTTQNEAS